MLTAGSGRGIRTTAAMSVSAEFKAVRAPHAMMLDPSLQDPAWALGEIEPNGFWNLTKRAPARFSTRVYLLYDDRNLYVGFHAKQAGVPIIAEQSTNNVGFGPR